MKRFKRILCFAEPDQSCKQALERAVALAENNQASLTVVDVVTRITAGIGMPDGGPISADLQASIITAHAQTLETLVKPFRKRLEIETKVLLGTPFLQVIREVLRNDYDLLIKVPERHDWLDQLFGSNDMHLLRKCPCPVWMIKPMAAKHYRNILAAVDIDETLPSREKAAVRELNHQIIEIASSLALSESAELHIVHAWEAIGETAMRSTFMHTPEDQISAYVELGRKQHAQSLKTLLRDAAATSGNALDYLKPQTHLVKGWARREIPLLARKIDADLVVMGTVARTGIPGFIIGNTAESILNQLDCSVLAIKPPHFVTPVTLEE